MQSYFKFRFSKHFKILTAFFHNYNHQNFFSKVNSIKQKLAKDVERKLIGSSERKKVIILIGLIVRAISKLISDVLKIVFVLKQWQQQKFDKLLVLLLLFLFFIIIIIVFPLYNKYFIRKKLFNCKRNMKNQTHTNTHIQTFML